MEKASKIIVTGFMFFTMFNSTNGMLNKHGYAGYQRLSTNDNKTKNIQEIATETVENFASKNDIFKWVCEKCSERLVQSHSEIYNKYWIQARELVKAIINYEHTVNFSEVSADIQEFKLGNILMQAYFLSEHKKESKDKISKKEKNDLKLGQTIILKYLDRYTLTDIERFSSTGNAISKRKTSSGILEKCDNFYKELVAKQNAENRGNQNITTITMEQFEKSVLKDFINKTSYSSNDLLKEIIMK